MDILEKIIGQITKTYNEYGYVNEDLILDLVNKYDISLEHIDSICDIVLAKGIIIHEGHNDLALEDEVESEDEIFDRSRTNYDSMFEQIVNIDPTLKNFIDEIKKIRPPQQKEFQNLILQAKNENVFAKERIIKMYMRTAIKHAFWFHEEYNLPLADTIQEAFVGLVTAFNQFKIDKHDQFISYSSLWIRQIILREFNICDSHIYFPVFIKEKVIRVLKYIKRFIVCDNYSYDDIPLNIQKKISREFGCSYEKAKKILKLFHNPISFMNLEDGDSIWKDSLTNYEDLIFNKIGQIELEQRFENLFEKLSDKEKLIIKLRYGFDNNKEHTLEELGKIVGVTRERVRQIEFKAFTRLRQPINSKYLKDFL